MHGLGVTEHRWGSHGVMAICNLALATGNVGRPGTGVNPLRGQNNVQGASDVGCLPTYFTGYQPFNDPVLGELHQRITGRPLPTTRGMKIPDMWDAALEGRLNGLWIIGYDVAQTDPNLKKYEDMLKCLNDPATKTLMDEIAVHKTEWLAADAAGDSARRRAAFAKLGPLIARYEALDHEADAFNVQALAAATWPTGPA